MDVRCEFEAPMSAYHRAETVSARQRDRPIKEIRADGAADRAVEFSERCRLLGEVGSVGDVLGQEGAQLVAIHDGVREQSAVVTVHLTTTRCHSRVNLIRR